MAIDNIDIGYIADFNKSNNIGHIKSAFSNKLFEFTAQQLYPVLDSNSQIIPSECSVFQFINNSNNKVLRFIDINEFKQHTQALKELHYKWAYECQNSIEDLNLPQLLVLSLFSILSLYFKKNDDKELIIDINSAVPTAQCIRDYVQIDHPSGVYCKVWRRYGNGAESWLCVVYNGNWAKRSVSSSSPVIRTLDDGKKLQLAFYTFDYVIKWAKSAASYLKTFYVDEITEGFARLSLSKKFFKENSKVLRLQENNIIIQKINNYKEELLNDKYAAIETKNLKLLGPELKELVPYISTESLIKAGKTLVAQNKALKNEYNNLKLEQIQQDTTIAELKEEREFLYSESATIEQKYQNLKESNTWMSQILTNKQNNNTDSDICDSILELISNENINNLKPTKCLDIIKFLAKNYVIILPEAYSSASKVDNIFKNNHSLLKILTKLVTQYRQSIISSGESSARKVFSNKEYSFNESETLKNTKDSEIWSDRTVLYNGEQIKLTKHLKIGVANNKSYTIRVYFFFDNKTQKIIIGYCGQHPKITKL